MKKDNQSLISVEKIEHSILLIRGQKIILDTDLAPLYKVTVSQFNQAVKRHLNRFPEDFMFQLTIEEHENLRSQSVISSYGGRRYLPYAFTKYGVAMLSRILSSERAVLVNIEIMRTFGRLRKLLASHEGLATKLEELEKKYDRKFSIVFQAIKELMSPPEDTNKTPIGF